MQFDLTISDNWETRGTGSDIAGIWKPCEVGECFTAILTFEIVDFPYIDPCEGTVGRDVGASVEDLVNALTTTPGFEAGPVTDVSIDGYAGKSFEFAFVGYADQSCVGDATWQWLTGDDRVGFGTGLRQRVIVSTSTVLGSSWLPYRTGATGRRWTRSLTRSTSTDRPSGNADGRAEIVPRGRSARVTRSHAIAWSVGPPSRP